jgi:hypothetical protein
MRFRFAILPVFIGTCLLSGCSVTGRLYPVQGPLAQLTPTPIYNAKLTAPPSLAFTTTLANGETFAGKMRTLSGPPATPPTPSDAPLTLPQANIAGAWDAVYGQGFYVAHVLGQQLGRANITGSQGTSIQVEVWNARGVALDNKGDVYKLVFSLGTPPPAQ